MIRDQRIYISFVPLFTSSSAKIPNLPKLVIIIGTLQKKARESCRRPSHYPRLLALPNNQRRTTQKPTHEVYIKPISNMSCIKCTSHRYKV